MIPVNEPKIGAREHDYVLECLRSGWISSAGKYIQAFESSWAAYCGRRHGVVTSSGTSALQTAVACLNLDADDEVIMPTFTIISCALAALYNGGVPVLVDADPETWCMDSGQVEARITPRTRAIMAVHIYGHPVDMDPLLTLAEKHDLALIEDAAEAHGAQYLRGHAGEQAEWVRCGSMGTLSIFSFYANKLVTTGEGGMLLCEDPEVAARARSLRNLCFQSERRFHHDELGHNFRLTNVQAALGLAQTERIAETVARKRWMGKAYTEGLSGIPGLQLPVERIWARQVYWMYGVVLDPEHGLSADEFAARLRERGVETRPFFLGMHAQPVLQKRGLFQDETYPIADHLARQGLYLPSGLGLSEVQLEQVCAAVREILL
ncbi:MAG: DegT/DnrJ/EryC1/StrS family aminotransferase [Anaerolineales bacterium]|jgi:perosamine synthetase|nr:DegT/DnrJ/EryC1/StrS family aminotransferase [Anaerolineales bacterium]